VNTRERAELIIESVCNDVDTFRSNAKIVAKAYLDQQWIPVSERLPEMDEKVWFWLIPKEPEECPHDTSGNPITAKGEPAFKTICRWNCWGSLYKPTHWMPPPPPPESE